MPHDSSWATTVARKLKLTQAARPAIVNDPGDYREALGATIEGDIAPGIQGAVHDWILAFVPDRAGLQTRLPEAAAGLASPGTLWVAYPKGTSGIQTDLTRDEGWEIVRDTDLMWLALVSIDETWSAFSFRHYKPGEARQTFR